MEIAMRNGPAKAQEGCKRSPKAPGGRVMLQVITALALIVVSASFQSDRAAAQFERREFYSIPSAAMSSEDFLTGKKGTPVALAGELRFPKVGPEKQPAVVLLHGAGGLLGTAGNYEEWTRFLNEAGIATFAIDSFAGRGIMPEDSAKVAPITRTIDAFRALEVLAKHPMIDAARIGVMEFSHGSVAALYSNMARFRKMYANSDAQFAAHIAVYSICTVRYREDEDIGKPLLMLHGGADDWLPIEACKGYAERLTKAGKNHLVGREGRQQVTWVGFNVRQPPLVRLARQDVRHPVMDVGLKASKRDRGVR
jgi:dienelactone hydrolase